MKLLLQAAIAALTSVVAVDVDVTVGPFGPIQGAENRLLARLRRDAVGSRRPAAAARVSHPTGLLVWGESLFATEFRRDRVLVASTARAAGTHAVSRNCLSPHSSVHRTSSLHGLRFENEAIAEPRRTWIES